MLIIHSPSSPEERAAAILTAMQDDRLNLRARGLLGLLLSHPNEEWPYQSMDRLADSISDRQRALSGPDGESKGAARKALAELEAAGYLVRRMGGRGSRPRMFIEIFHSSSDVDVIPTPDGPDDIAEVYMVGKAGGSVVKIGTTKNLQARLRSLQAGYPLQIEVRWHRSGGWALEQYLHKYFAKFRLEGEWFDFGKQDPVDAVLKAVAKKYPEEYPDWPLPRPR